MFNEFNTLPISHAHTENIKTHIADIGNMTRFYTLDHENKKLSHFSYIKHEDNSRFGFPYDEQVGVEREKSNKVLSSGFATQFIYDHFKNSGKVLKSSDHQYDTGHKMWINLIDKALDDKHHVYYHDERSGDVSKLTTDNKEDFHNKYYGVENDYTKKHIFISHHPLTFNNNLTESAWHTSVEPELHVTKRDSKLPIDHVRDIVSEHQKLGHTLVDDAAVVLHRPLVTNRGGGCLRTIHMKKDDNNHIVLHVKFRGSQSRPHTDYKITRESREYK
jgi:hypothetical protein